MFNSQKILSCNIHVLKCCPSSWDCGAWEERLRRWDECFWTDAKDPRGRYYAIGDSVPEASDEGACRATCKCVEGPDGEAQVRAKNIDKQRGKVGGEGVRFDKLLKTTSVKDKNKKGTLDSF
jgi:hypothetical protein